MTAEPGRSPATARDYARARSLLAAARARNQRALSEPEAKAILRLSEIPTPAGGVATSTVEARALAARLRPPLALKIVSPDILHKSDIGGIELNVAGDAEAGAAYERIMRRVRERLPEARLDGVLVEDMAPGGVEVVASVTRDPQLGPVLMVGLGGLWVELLHDVSFRLVPVDRADVIEMLGELQAAPVLSGARGGVAVDRNALVDALLALNDLFREMGEDVQEVEINPLIVSSHGVSAIDAVILLQGGT